MLRWFHNGLGSVLRSAVLFLSVCATSAWAGARVDIPKPTDPLQPAPPPPAIEQSVVNLEVSLSAEELADAADQAFPLVAAREDGWNEAQTLPGREDLRFLYRLVRGPFRYRVDQNRFEMKFEEIRYRIWVRQTQPDTVVDARCGHGNDPPKQLRVLARSVLTWSDTWQLQAQTTVDPPVFVEPCRFRELDLDATPLLQSVLQPKLTSLAETIDRKIRDRTDAQHRATTVWRKLQEPVELAPDQWLVFNLRDARVGPIGSHGTLLLQTSVNLFMEPQVIHGARPTVTEVPLPPLQLVPSALDGFHLALPFRADYERINRRLTQLMVGQVIDAPPGEPLTITGVELYGSGNRLILALRVAGGINGTLYAAGKPVFDEANRTLRFVDLDFTVDTKNVLVRSINRFWHDALLDRLTSEALIDLSEPLKMLEGRLNAALTRDLAPGARLDGAITTMRPQSIYPVPRGIEVQLIVDGFMRLKLGRGES